LEECNEEGKEIGLVFSNTSFHVAIFLFAENSVNDKMDRLNIITLIEENLPDPIEGYGKTSEKNGSLIFIFAVTESEDALKDYLVKLHSWLNVEHGLQSTIGIGNGYSQVSWISKSFIEASTAVDYRLIKGRNNVIYFNDIRPYNTFHYNYPVQEIKALETAVMEGHTEVIDQLLGSLYTLINKSGMPLFEARCLCFDIINTVIKSICLVDKKYYRSKEDYPDVLSLAGFETVDELWAMVQTISAGICKHMKESEHNHSQSLMDNIAAYIQEHYHDSQFSIQNMADHFGMSQAQFSHLFKQARDITIFDFVNHLRMERAKQLLLESDEPLSLIVQKIGYSDVSSFVRKFKNMFGTTPGVYRKTKVFK
jgi:AraC-like DNA-binding protein